MLSRGGRAPSSSGCLAQNLLFQPPFYQLNPSVPGMVRHQQPWHGAQPFPRGRESDQEISAWWCSCLSGHLVPSAADVLGRGQE